MKSNISSFIERLIPQLICRLLHLCTCIFVDARIAYATSPNCMHLIKVFYVHREVNPVLEGMSGGQGMVFMILLQCTINVAKSQFTLKEKREIYFLSLSFSFFLFLSLSFSFFLFLSLSFFLSFLF